MYTTMYSGCNLEVPIYLKMNKIDTKTQKHSSIMGYDAV